MGERQRVRLDFNAGLERDAGIGVARLGSFQDLRNVYLQRGRVLARRGLEHAVDLLDEDGNPVTHVVCFHEVQAEGVGIAVGYQQANGRAYVYRVSGDGLHAELLTVAPGQAYWFDLDADADPPRIFAAEVYGLVFLAHDEPVVTDRAQTAYYDPTAPIPVQLLSADLTGRNELAPVKFRGVTRYLNYLVGWGFGNDDDRDRPELVRASLPGEPLRFDPNHYWICGARSDPVLNCTPCPAGLVVYKAAETHLIIGYSAETFGERPLPLDSEFGLLGSRLVATDGERVFSWSHAGPRVTDGRGASIDLAIPLNLGGQEPATLVAAASAQNGFAVYLAERRIVLFVFGKRGYALSFAKPDEPPEWSYVEFGIELFCAGTMRGGPAVGGPTVHQPIGYPSVAPLAEWKAISDFYARVLFDNHDPTPGCVCEAWLRRNGDPWPSSPATQVVVDTGKERQELPLLHLSAGVTYDLALRYRSGGLYAPGYEGATPDDWTAATAPQSKATFTTTATRRRILAAVWHRIDAATETLTLTIDGGAPDTATQIEVAVKDPATGVYGAYAPATGSPVAFTTLPFEYIYTIPAGQEEHALKFRARSDDGGGNVGPWSLEFETWAGPQQPLGNDHGSVMIEGRVGEAPTISQYELYMEDPRTGQPTIVDPTQIGLIVRWLNADPTYETEIWVAQNGDPYFLQVTAPSAATRIDTTVARIPGTLQVKLRHKVTTFSVVDYSDFTHEATEEVFPA